MECGGGRGGWESGLWEGGRGGDTSSVRWGSWKSAGSPPMLPAGAPRSADTPLSLSPSPPAADRSG